jgi:hypothetical protein
MGHVRHAHRRELGAASSARKVVAPFVRLQRPDSQRCDVKPPPLKSVTAERFLSCRFGMGWVYSALTRRGRSVPRTAVSLGREDGTMTKIFHTPTLIGSASWIGVALFLVSCSSVQETPTKEKEHTQTTRQALCGSSRGWEAEYCTDSTYVTQWGTPCEEYSRCAGSYMSYEDCTQESQDYCASRGADCIRNVQNCRDLPEHYCNDGVCDANENCESCPDDCGACGGGGGGSCRMQLEPCTPGFSQCCSGLICPFGGPYIGTCIPPYWVNQSGDPCEQDNQCASGSCVWDGTGPTGKHCF